jgi:hypothetical protein
LVEGVNVKAKAVGVTTRRKKNKSSGENNNDRIIIRLLYCTSTVRRYNVLSVCFVFLVAVQARQYEVLYCGFFLWTLLLLRLEMRWLQVGRMGYGRLSQQHSAINNNNQDQKKKCENCVLLLARRKRKKTQEGTRAQKK